MAESDHQGKSAPSDLWPHVLTASAIAIAGIIIAFTVVAWALGVQSGERQRSAIINANHATLIALFNGRINDLTVQLQQIASAPETVTAALSNDEAIISAVQDRLRAHIPSAQRVAIFERGRAEVDLSSSVPITFAALEVIKGAETSAFSGPEAAVGQRNMIYAAVPITSQGRVAGVLFVVLSQEYFLEPLSALPSGIGSMTIVQTFAGTQPGNVLSWGSDGLSEHRVEQTLAAPHWALAYDPSGSIVPPTPYIGALLTPLGMCIIVVLAGIYLAFSRLFRKLDSDLDALTQYAAKRIRGRKAQLAQYELAGIQRVAIALSKQEAGRPETEPQEAASSPKRRPARTKAAETVRNVQASELMAAAEAEGNDFLEVEPKRVAAEDNFGIEVDENIGPIDMGLKLDANIFRAYDIRGITTDNLTEEVVYWIGRSFAAEALAANQHRAAIGRDGRLSSEPLRDALVRGINEGGMDTIDIGLVPTPVLYYATHELDTGTGIMITGSHNPPEYNGLKMMIGGVTLAEDRIQQLYQRLLDNNLSDGAGSADSFSIDQTYVDRILSDVVLAQPLKVVVDCGNGVAGAVAPQLLESLGCEVIPLYCDVDGTFPNHHPDPAEPHNLEDLITVVQAENADVGLAFDGDGDRLGVVTNTGEIIWPDKLMMLFSQDIVSRNPGADIIYDVKCSRHLNTLISEYGGRPIMWKTGHSHIKAKMKETGALLAGEFSGHICFGERWYGFDDALYSAARLLEIISAESQPTSELFAQFPVTFTTPELKIHTTEERKFEVMDELASRADFGDGTMTTIDGLRVDYADGWGLIRPSNTSPVLSLRFEADGQTALARIRDAFAAQLEAIDPEMQIPR